MKTDLDIKKIIVILTNGTDIITICLNSISPFPIEQYAPLLKMEAQQGYGVEYCRTVFGVEPIIIDARYD